MISNHAIVTFTLTIKKDQSLQDIAEEFFNANPYDAVSVDDYYERLLIEAEEQDLYGTHLEEGEKFHIHLIRKETVEGAVRCPQCGTLLGRNLHGSIQIKCKRCKTVSDLKAE